ncbi:MAG: lytic transglycosylase domain-containing protein [Terriglobia bacterium]
MRNHSAPVRSIIMCALALVWIVTGSMLARAEEIASVTDQHGHIIFVNATEPPPSPTRITRTSRWRYYGTPTPEITSLVQKTAGEHKVDPKLVNAIIQVESGYNPRAVSRKGARGLMQLIPATAARFGVQNSFNPKQNIEGGVTYLKYLLDLFGGNIPLSVAAYNAGENAVLKKGGIPPYAETVNYVQRVTGLYNPGQQESSQIQTYSEPQDAQIYRLVDNQGVVHYTNGDGL